MQQTGMKHEVMKRPKLFRIHFLCRVRASSIRTKAPHAVPQRTLPMPAYNNFYSFYP